MHWCGKAEWWNWWCWQQHWSLPGIGGAARIHTSRDLPACPQACLGKLNWPLDCFAPVINTLVGMISVKRPYNYILYFIIYYIILYTIYIIYYILCIDDDTDRRLLTIDVQKVPDPIIALLIVHPPPDDSLREWLCHDLDILTAPNTVCSHRWVLLYHILFRDFVKKIISNHHGVFRVEKHVNEENVFSFHVSAF